MASELNGKGKIRGIDAKNLKEAIICRACNKQYKDPRTLPCLHSFCSTCIKSLVSSEDKTQLELACPQCKKHISEKSTVVDDLPEAFSINRQIAAYAFIQKVQGKTDVRCDKCAGKSVKAVSYCKDCSQFICDLCVTIHKNWSEFSSHQVTKLSDLKDCSEKFIPDQMMSGPVKCREHAKECSLYCETCEEEICNECMIKMHRDHQYNLSTDSAEHHKEKMKQKAEKIVGVPRELEKAVRRIDGISSHFLKQSNAATNAVNKVFDEFEAEVVKQRKALHDQVTALVTTKTALLGNQKKELVALKNKVSDCQSFVGEALSTDHNSEFFVLQQNMSDRIAEMSFEFSSTDLTPIEEPEVHFSSDKTMLQKVPTFGNVCDGSVLHPSSICSRNPVVKEVLTFYIALSSAFYKMRGNPVNEVTAEIESLRDGSTCPATVAVSNSGFAKIQCSFAERGRYRLNVCVSGRSISGSPYSLFVRPASTQFDTPVRSITKLGSPKGIAVNPKHQMIISEEKMHTVSIFGRKCKKVTSFGSYGTKEGELNNPIGVAVDSLGNIFIADSKNNRVLKVDPEGKLILSFTGDNIPECGFLNNPTGLKIDKSGDVFVVDRGNCRIVILDLELKFKRLFGSPGAAFGQLQDPWDIAFDEHSLMYITDIKLHCIHVFGSEGTFRGRIGSMGTQKGRLNRPSGIAIDQFGRIFVCEFGNHRVSIFHVSSEFIDCFSAGLNMVNPCALVINDDGFLCVSCADAVHVF